MNIEILHRETKTVSDDTSSILTFSYELEVEDFYITASISTDLFCYDKNEYDPKYHKAFASNKRFINDTPKITINSADCFDDQQYFSIDVQCEVVRVLLTDFYASKNQYLS